VLRALAAAFLGTAGFAVGLGLVVWSNFASAPQWLTRADDAVARWVTRHQTAHLNESIVKLATDELQVQKLPVGYRYQPLPYPVPANWDDETIGPCEVQRYGRIIPNPKSPVYEPTDSTVDGMYGVFLGSVRPPPELRVAKDLFGAYLGSRAQLDRIQREIRKEAGKSAAEEWRRLRRQSAEQVLALNKQLEHALSESARTYAQALTNYTNAAFRHDITCGAVVQNQPGYAIQGSLREFREAGSTRSSIASVAELIEVPVGTQDGRTSGTGLEIGTVTTDLSFRKARLFRIEPEAWFSKEAIALLSTSIPPGGRQMWGDAGLFPLMPIAVLAVTEPVLKVNLTKEQAQKLRDLFARGSTMQVGQFRFDFTKSGTYSVANADGSLKTELQLVAPRNEVVVLGVISKRHDVR